MWLQTRSGAVPWTVHDPGHIQSPRSQNSLSSQLSKAASLAASPSLSADLEPAISIAARPSHIDSDNDKASQFHCLLQDK